MSPTEVRARTSTVSAVASGRVGGFERVAHVAEPRR